MKIYSATQFFNELDLLEIRLETLDPVVDYFIISESTKTHSGLDKPLYFQESGDRFNKFRSKIIHQVITDTPATPQEMFLMTPQDDLHRKAIQNVFNATWFDKNIESYLRDDYEKESLIRAMSFCQPEDIIILGDLDEIPRPSAVKYVKDNFDANQIYNFNNDMFYYYFNNQKVNEPWIGVLALSYANLLNNSFCELRTHRRGLGIQNAGWHFTYMGGAEKVKQKVQSWGEQSLNTEAVRNNIENSIENCLTSKMDLFSRPAEFVLRDINDGSFPEYIVNNQDKFEKYIKRI